MYEEPGETEDDIDAARRSGRSRGGKEWLRVTGHPTSAYKVGSDVTLTTVSDLMDKRCSEGLVRFREHFVKRWP